MRPKLKNTSDRATCVGGSNPLCHLRRGSLIPRVSQLISLKLSDNKGLRLIYFCKSVCIAEEDKNGEKYYIFKGDNNDEEDPKPIHRKRIKFKIRDK